MPRARSNGEARGQHQHRHRTRMRIAPDITAQFVTVGTGHDHVEKSDIEPALFDHRQRRFGIFGRLAVDAQTQQGAAQLFAHRQTVVHHQGIQLATGQRVGTDGTALRNRHHLDLGGLPVLDDDFRRKPAFFLPMLEFDELGQRADDLQEQRSAFDLVRRVSGQALLRNRDRHQVRIGIPQSAIGHDAFRRCRIHDRDVHTLIRVLADGPERIAIDARGVDDIGQYARVSGGQAAQSDCELHSRPFADPDQNRSMPHTNAGFVDKTYRFDMNPGTGTSSSVSLRSRRRQPVECDSSARMSYALSRFSGACVSACLPQAPGVRPKAGVRQCRSTPHHSTICAPQHRAAIEGIYDSRIHRVDRYTKAIDASADESRAASAMRSGIRVEQSLVAAGVQRTASACRKSTRTLSKRLDQASGA